MTTKVQFPKETAGKGPPSVFLLLDTSGSMDTCLSQSSSSMSMSAMTGIRRIDAVRAAANLILTCLPENTAVDIGEFNSRTRWAFGGLNATPTTLNEENKSAAQMFVSRLSASGGTELGPALRAVKAACEANPAHSHGVVIVITDGEVANTSKLVTEMQLAHFQTGMHIHGITVGAGASQSLVQRLAFVSGGSFMSYPKGNLEGFAGSVMEFVGSGILGPCMSIDDIQWTMRGLMAVC